MKNFVREFVLLLVIFCAGTCLLWSGREKSDTQALQSDDSRTAETNWARGPAIRKVDAHRIRHRAFESEYISQFHNFSSS